MTPRTGRPTDNPKYYRIGVRIDENTKKILDLYCEQKQVTPTEAVRQGLSKLEPEINKKK